MRTDGRMRRLCASGGFIGSAPKIFRTLSVDNLLFVGQERMLRWRESLFVASPWMKDDDGAWLGMNAIDF